MNKFAVSLIALAALSTASFAADRGIDPDVTLGGRALSTVSSPAINAGSAFAVEQDSTASGRLNMNAADYQYIR